MVHEQPALEVIHLVLQTYGVHALQFTLEVLPRGILRAHLQARCPQHACRYAWYRQAALFGDAR